MKVEKDIDPKNAHTKIKIPTGIGIAGIVMLLLANVAYAVIPLSDGFDFPAGRPEGTDYKRGQDIGDWDGWGFLEDEGPVFHPGEDWNRGTGDDDLGDPVYAIANGRVVEAGDYGCGWGNIILIEHKLPNGTIVWSNYAHLDSIVVSDGYVNRGQQIGTIGKGITSKPCDKDPYSAHLHFEIRKNYLSPKSWKPIVESEDQVNANYYNPSDFIDNHRPQIFPVIGDWDGNGIDETGTFNPRESRFILKDAKDKEYENQQIGEAGDLPIVGDWNGDGATNNEDTIGVYRPKEAKFYLDNDNDGIVGDTPEERFPFGNIGDYPITGDWDGNGRDEVGVYRISDDGKKATFYLKKPDAMEEVKFNITANDTPIVGDWNNDGTDDVGIFRRYDANHKQNSVFYLRFDGKITEIEFGDNTDIPVAGKLKKDKLTKIGIYRPSEGEFHFDTKPVVPKSDKPSLVLDYPTGGETWLLGSIETIQWTLSGDIGTNLNIALLKKGTSVGEITAPISASSAQMTISDTQIEGKDYQIRITSVEKPEYVSISNHFTISATVPIPTPTPSPTPTPIPAGPIHNVNKNKDYIKIQDAIDDANIEDEIDVYSGTYLEVVNVSKKLTVEGIDSGSGMPIIDGQKKDNVVRLYASNVTFRNFTLVNASEWSSGIEVPSSGNKITYNVIKNNSHGINVGYHSHDNIIEGNNITNSSVGISLYYFSYNNTLTGNDLHGNDFGVYFTYTTKNILDGNYIRSSDYGLYFFNGADYSINNQIYRNKFMGNTADTDIKYPYPNANIWNSTESMTYNYGGKTYSNYLGNYWDKYAGSDSDKDGIGDTPHPISDVSKEADSYPLISQNVG